MCEPSDHEEDVIKGVVIGILVVVENVMEPLPAFYNDVALVIEEEVVMRHLSDKPYAFLNLMGLVYTLNLDYPKELGLLQHLPCYTVLKYKSIVILDLVVISVTLVFLNFFQTDCFLFPLSCFLFPCHV